MPIERLVPPAALDDSGDDAGAAGSKSPPPPILEICDDDPEPSWSACFMLLPRPHRGLLLDYLSKVSREAMDASAEAAALRAEIELLRPAPSRAERLRQRDEAIRDALRQFEGPPTVRAKLLEAEIAHVAGLKTPDRASARRQAVAKILRLNEGRTLAWRQIQNIACGYRTE